MRPHKFSPVSDKQVPLYGGPNSRGLRDGEAMHKFPQHDPTDNIVESFGACKNALKPVRRGTRTEGKCKEYHTTLGNGYCQTCWDILADGTKFDDKEKTKDRFQGTKIN